MKKLDNIINTMLVLIMSVSCLTVFIAVISRYFLKSPLNFSFALSTFLMCWLLFLALPLAYKHGYHVAMDNLLDFLPVKLKLFIQLAINFIVVIVLLILTYFGVQLTMFTGMILQELYIPQSWLYVSLPIGCLLTVLYIIIDSIQTIRKGIEA